MAGVDNLKPFKPGHPKYGGKQKGYKHISTWIQEMLNDEDFTLDNFLFNGKQFKGAPLKAIITVAMMESLQGDNKWAEWLAKHGYTQQIDITSQGEKIEPMVIYLPEQDKE